MLTTYDKYLIYNPWVQISSHSASPQQSETKVIHPAGTNQTEAPPMSELFVCVSCGREIAHQPGNGTGIANPRCGCGSKTKKAYSKPVFRKFSKAEALLRLGVSPNKGAFPMRRISTFFESILSATLLFLGVFMLYEGSLDKTASDSAILIGGAVCSTLGVMTLFAAVTSILWHRRMKKHSLSNHDLGNAAHGR
jgi:hypothetical protein